MIFPWSGQQTSKDEAETLTYETAESSMTARCQAPVLLNWQNNLIRDLYKNIRYKDRMKKRQLNFPGILQIADGSKSESEAIIPTNRKVTG